ncbi:MAG: hypothetical protein H6745_30985 [Deltaproteobacteria bacterium]|nr:hypothetical protein [Deltaproteobacteria bacterium]
MAPMRKVHALVGLAAALSGCVTYAFTPTTRQSAPAREAGCEFDLLSAAPRTPYVQLGFLEPTVQAHSAVEFYDAVRGEVCAAGGDAVLTEINGLGEYVRGTVIAYVE